MSTFTFLTCHAALTKELAHKKYPPGGTQAIPVMLIGPLGQLMRCFEMEKDLGCRLVSK